MCCRGPCLWAPLCTKRSQSHWVLRTTNTLLHRPLWIILGLTKVHHFAHGGNPKKGGFHVGNAINLPFGDGSYHLWWFGDGLLLGLPHYEYIMYISPWKICHYEYDAGASVPCSSSATLLHTWCGDEAEILYPAHHFFGFLQLHPPKHMVYRCL